MIPLRVYSSLRNAFIFQLTVAFFCLLGIMLIGGQMIAILALMGLRPLLLRKQTVQSPASYWRFYYRIGKISFVFTAIAVVILYVFLLLTEDLSIAIVLDPRTWFISVLPFFIGVHGMVGLICLNQFGID